MWCDEPTSPDRPVALVDLGDTLCDCSGVLHQWLAQLRGPGEHAEDEHLQPLPPHLEARRRLVMAAPGFWAALPPLPRGLELLDLLRDEGYAVHVLTKGPKESPAAWADKVAWCRLHVPGVPVVVTDDKSLVQGDLLVDDWFPYVQRWQQRHPGALAIVPARPWNVGAATQPHCVRYDGLDPSGLRAELRASRQARTPPDPEATQSDRK